MYIPQMLFGYEKQILNRDDYQSFLSDYLSYFDINEDVFNGYLSGQKCSKTVASKSVPESDYTTELTVFKI